MALNFNHKLSISKNKNNKKKISSEPPLTCTNKSVSSESFVTRTSISTGGIATRPILLVTTMGGGRPTFVNICQT